RRGPSWLSDFSDARKDALRHGYAARCDAPFGSQVELHLTDLCKPLLHVVKMRTRFALEARKIPPYGTEIRLDFALGRLAVCQLRNETLLCPQHRPVGDVKAPNLVGERA